MAERPKKKTASRRTSKAGQSKAVLGRKRAKPASTVAVLVLSGPNLHRLGVREPSIYGTETLEDIHGRLRALASELGVRVEARQSNHEGELVTWIGEAEEAGFLGILLNPAAFTHTSVAIYDAILGAGIPTVELHLSNPDAREEFRKKSLVAPACAGRIAGFGGESYLLALRGLARRLTAE